MKRTQKGRSYQSRRFRRSIDALTSPEAESAANRLEGFLTWTYPRRVAMTAEEAARPENAFKVVPRGWLREGFTGPEELETYIKGLDESHRFEACYLVQEHLAARLDHEATAAYWDSLPPLIRAARSGRGVHVRELLEAGVDPDQPDEEFGESPLRVAAFYDHPRVVKALLNAGAAVNGTSRMGSTALHGAALNAGRRTVRLLLKAGADVAHRDSDGDTPLTYAADSGKAAAIRLLLRHGADVNEQGDSEFTALISAAESGRRRTVNLLLAAGALDLRDDEGRDAAWHSRHQGHESIAVSIEKHFKR